MKINDIFHALTSHDCCNIGRLLLSKAINGNNTDFIVELSPEEETLISYVTGERVEDALHNGLCAAHELRTKFKCTYYDRIFTSVAA